MSLKISTDSKNRTDEEKSRLIKEKFESLIKAIAEILEVINELLKNEKITLEDYDIMATAIDNLNYYLYSRYDKYEDVDEEVKRMVKTFWDPVLVEKGKTEGKIEGK